MNKSASAKESRQGWLAGCREKGGHVFSISHPFVGARLLFGVWADLEPTHVDFIHFSWRNSGEEEGAVVSTGTSHS